MLAVGAVGACAGFLVFADPLITAVYDRAVRRWRPTPPGCCASARASTSSRCFAFTTLVAVSRNRLYPIAMLLGVVVNVGLNLVLIPRTRTSGSGWATVVTESLVLVVLGVGVLRIPGAAAAPVGRDRQDRRCRGVSAGVAAGCSSVACPWPVGLARSRSSTSALVHVLAPNGPGGSAGVRRRAARRPGAAVEQGIDRPDLGTGLPGLNERHARV